MSVCRSLLILLFLLQVDRVAHAIPPIPHILGTPVPNIAGTRVPNVGQIIYRDGDLEFAWDYEHDRAALSFLPAHATVWQGSLLPAFWLMTAHNKQFVKASVISATTTPANGVNSTTLQLRIGALGRGMLMVSKENWGIRFSDLSIEWDQPAPAIIEMYFGVSDSAIRNPEVWPTWDRPFMPDWQAAGFCVPGAKGGTPQSYFRSWDFGQANLALGSFGPSMGSPYGAAYPRPLLYAAMGSDQGCIALGAGAIPDAAMSLHIQSTKGCFQYLYAEDLWGASTNKKRTWAEPLRLSFGTNAWSAFKKYYSSFPIRPAANAHANSADWNTWGMWGQGKYVIGPITDFSKTIGAGLLVMDGSWEASEGAARPNGQRFPHFMEELEAARDKGLGIGIWESIGWISDPFANGLKKEDLVCNRNGQPCKANWNFDPNSPSYYCIDPSSEAARKYIRERTTRVMQTIKPRLLKLDFGYGLPSPEMGVPRDPTYRGERYAYELVKLISQTAKMVDPEVVIMYYGISPLWTGDVDLVSLDDQNDLWYDVARGGQEWSIWASLLSDRKVGINASSGYAWDQDDEAVLNTCILGAPGAVLPVSLKNGDPIPDKYLHRRLAIDKWFRRTTAWEPLWLNSQTGNFSAPPKLNCWGRMEVTGGDSVLTSLVLRDGDKDRLTDPRIAKIDWSGRWALISQDDRDIFSSAALALIPFDAGFISLPYPAKPRRVTRLDKQGEKDFEGWEYSGGRLTIKLSEEVLRQTAGFQIIN
jgi:hypothetical protein